MEMLEQMGALSPSTQVDKKLATATQEKDQGNNFFKNGDHKMALYHYHRALLNVNGLHGISEAEQKLANEIKLSCNNNMAACQLKEGNFPKVIQRCDEVLKIDSNNVKALFRRGKAYIALNDLDRAQNDLEAAARLDPNDKAIQRELVVLKQKNKKADQKAKKFYANMFDKLQNEQGEQTSPEQDSLKASSVEARAEEAGDASQ